jgi:hypothetical protein
MIQGKIESSDMQLAKLLIARKLKEQAVEINPAKVLTSLEMPELSDSPLRFRYPLRGMNIGIRSFVRKPDDLTFKCILDLVEEQAAEYLRLSTACEGLERELVEVKAIAKQEAAKLRRRGTEVRLISVEPSTVEAGGSWLPVPEVLLEILSERLVPERFSIKAEETNHLSEKLNDEDFVLTQTIRAVRKEFLGGVGAGGAIDAVALAALISGGHDVPGVIRLMRESRHGFLLGTGETRMNLWWNNGLIDVAVGISDGVDYRAGKLFMEKPQAACLGSGLARQPVRTIVDSVLLDGALITKVRQVSGKQEVELERRYVIYDALTLEPRQQFFSI